MVVEHGGEFHAYLDRKSLVYVSDLQLRLRVNVPQNPYHYIVSHPRKGRGVPADENRQTGMAC